MSDTSSCESQGFPTQRRVGLGARLGVALGREREQEGVEGAEVRYVVSGGSNLKSVCIVAALVGAGMAWPGLSTQRRSTLCRYTSLSSRLISSEVLR
jgi:hypothetical protein